MMASLRREIADNLAGLAAVQPLTSEGSERAWAMFTGSRTLRWIEDNGYDQDADREDEARLDEIEQLSEDLAAALVDIYVLGMAQKDKATAMTPAGFRDAVLDAVEAVREYL